MQSRAVVTILTLAVALMLVPDSAEARKRRNGNGNGNGNGNSVVVNPDPRTTANQATILGRYATRNDERLTRSQRFFTQVAYDQGR